MRFDLHCHTKEGSFDSKIPITEYATKYMMLGYDGFMITDHNSYKGCKAWDEISNRPEYKNITVLKGIEYDTKDAGHVLVILPDGMYPSLLQIRGMRCKKLAHLVHFFGGILGPAHPFGIPSSSTMGFKLMSEKLLSYMDFVEVFNTCEKPLSNELAMELADKYNLPGFAGTDAHDSQYIGMAYTDIAADIHCNNDLIAAIHNEVTITAGGVEREETLKGKAKDHWISQIGYTIYNRGIAKLSMPARKLAHKNLFKEYNLDSDYLDKY